MCARLNSAGWIATETSAGPAFRNEARADVFDHILSPKQFERANES